MMDLAKRFVKENSYRTFDLNRADLVNLYQKEAVLFFEDEKIEGKEAILAKLTSLPFHQHDLGSIDCVPDGGDGGVIAVVMGGVHVDGKPEPLIFSEVIHLIPTPQGSFHIALDFFNMKFGGGKDGHFVFKPRVRPGALVFVGVSVGTR